MNNDPDYSESTQLISKAKSGCNKSTEILYISYQNLIHKIVNKYGYRRDIEDIYSIANYAFVRCLKNYDPSKSKFSTHLQINIQGYIKAALRPEKQQRRMKYKLISLDKQFDEDEDTLHSSVADSNNITVENLISNIDIFTLKQKLLKFMNEREKIIFEKCCFQDKTCTLIAKELNLSIELISRSRKRIYNKVYNYLLNSRTGVESYEFIQ